MRYKDGRRKNLFLIFKFSFQKSKIQWEIFISERIVEYSEDWGGGNVHAGGTMFQGAWYDLTLDKRS